MKMTLRTSTRRPRGNSKEERATRVLSIFTLVKPSRLSLHLVRWAGQAGLNPRSKIMRELDRIRKEKKKLSEVFKKRPSSFFQKQVAILPIIGVVHLVRFL